MLLRTIVIVAFVVALATALLHACAALARARAHRAAAIAAAAGFDRGLAAAQVAIASAIAGGDDPRSIAFVAPTPAPSCADARPDGSCALTVAVAIASTQTRPVAAAPAGSACAPACAHDLQGNDAVDEGRVSVRVTTSASGPSGTVFARRDRYAIFRTTRTPPDASLIGVRDASGEGVAIGEGEGEDAGTPALTTVDVRYVDAATGASIEGNAWRSAAWANADGGAAAWEP